MTKKKKKGRWSLKKVSFEFNVIVARVGAIFERKEIPVRSTRKQRTRIKREVNRELARIAEKEKRPTNIVAKTITQIADKERKKAIREGDYAAAIFAGIVQFYASQTGTSLPVEEHRW